MSHIPMVTLEVRISEMRQGIIAALHARELDLEKRISECLSAQLTDDKIQMLIWRTTSETTERVIKTITEDAVRKFFYNGPGHDLIDGAVKEKLRAELSKILARPDDEPH